MKPMQPSEAQLLTKRGKGEKKVVLYNAHSNQNGILFVSMLTKRGKREKKVVLYNAHSNKNSIPFVSMPS